MEDLSFSHPLNLDNLSNSLEKVANSIKNNPSKHLYLKVDLINNQITTSDKEENCIKTISLFIEERLKSNISNEEKIKNLSNYNVIIESYNNKISNVVLKVFAHIFKQGGGYR